MRSLLNVNEASKLLNVHPTHLRRLVSKKRIPFIKGELGIGVKFDPEKLESWIKAGEVAPET